MGKWKMGKWKIRRMKKTSLHVKHSINGHEASHPLEGYHRVIETDIGGYNKVSLIFELKNNTFTQYALYFIDNCFTRLPLEPSGSECIPNFPSIHMLIFFVNLKSDCSKR